jgi:WD40 repeat protein
VPVTTIQAHDAKIYGLDWDRGARHKLVTCSLGGCPYVVNFDTVADIADKTIKYWTVPELAEQATAFTDSHNEFYPSLEAPVEPTRTIRTSYPVWRARNLPFGDGVLALPQRGSKDLEMYGSGQQPVERFEGHDDVVKEFVWRNRGGHDQEHEDREFQLITWSKDRTLRIWPVSEEVTERVGYKRGAPIRILLSRKGAADITYTRAPNADEKHLLPPPVVAPSGIARLKAAKAETGMTRGGAKARSKGMEQLDWLTKVVKNKASPDSSALQSRVGSLTRNDARAPSSEGRGDWISLKDEVVLVHRMFPRPRINFEKVAPGSLQ